MAWTDTNWQLNESINSGFPYPEGISVAEFSVSEIPTPWKINSTINDSFPYVVEPVYFDNSNIPSPWHLSTGVNGGFVYTMEVSPLGAFMNVTNLKSATFPKSLKYIGPYSFTNTSLTEVTIPADCVYFDTSFPAGCEVKFFT